MDTSTARAAVKRRLGIPTGTTTFDNDIDDYVVSAVRRLYPTASLEVAYQDVTSFTVDDLGETTVNLETMTTPIKSARKVDAYDGESWSEITDKYHHGGKLRLRGVDTSITILRIYGLKHFPAITNVYDWLLQGVIWYAIAEFYDFLASNKSSYNIYMQVSGARAVDNMADQAAYFEQKARDFVQEQSTQYGS